jgi:hypothetical protein
MQISQSPTCFSQVGELNTFLNTTLKTGKEIFYWPKIQTFTQIRVGEAEKQHQLGRLSNTENRQRGAYRTLRDGGTSVEIEQLPKCALAQESDPVISTTWGK